MKKSVEIYNAEALAVNYYHLDFIEPIVITWIKRLICNVLGGAAVPLFFMFAGYLQFRKKDTYLVLLKKKTKSLLIPYVIWTIIGILAFFIGQSIPHIDTYFQNENNIVRDWKFIDWINLFWTHGTDNALKPPLVYQLWFVRNLIVLVIASPLLNYLAKKNTICSYYHCILVLFKWIIYWIRYSPIFFICAVISLLNTI